MCLLALALDAHRRFPLVVAANRDEFFARPAARLAWWTPEGANHPILGGRDQAAGGTWMGLTAQGRLAMLTNVRDPARFDPAAPSRGLIVPQWLAARERPDRFWARVAMSGHNGFNLVAADFRMGECFWVNSVQGLPQRLEKGIYGLSNASLDTPWPKVETLKARLSAALGAAADVDELALLLFSALADRTEAADESLPSTGVPRELEKQLSAAFIRTPDGLYGTRCSTLLISERLKRQTVTHVYERTFTAAGGMALLRRSQLTHWPPRYEMDAGGAGPEVQAGDVSESEAEAQPASYGTADLPQAQTPKRTRVRSLLKPPSAGRPRG